MAVRGLAFLQARYREIKQAYLDSLGTTVPARYQSHFVHWGEGSTELLFIYRRFLKDIPKGGKILIVGVLGGRDYFFCKSLGYEVVAVDLGPQPEIAPIVCCNVEDDLPFHDGYFDAVIISEVLEHLGEDVRALQNLRRVLKPGGKLVVSIPFYHDQEAGHMRIHSPESGRRLLAMGGFTVEDYLERPGFFRFPGMNILQHGISLLTYQLTGETAYPWLTRWYGRLEWRFGHILWLRGLRQWAGKFGGYYLCSKAETLNYVALNKKLYTSAQLV